MNEEGVVSPHGAVGPRVVQSGSVGEESGHDAALDGLRVTYGGGDWRTAHLVELAHLRKK